MAVEAQRNIGLKYVGDINAEFSLAAGVNSGSPGEIELKALTTGANTITVPTGGSATPTAVTIIPPVLNTAAMTIKGVAGDIGIRLHDTDPTSISLDDSVTSLVITAETEINGVRLFWS